jgi:hypothetical protein
MNHMNTTLSATALAIIATTTWAQDRSAMTQEPPRFYANTYPEYALNSRLEAGESRLRS